MERSGLPSLETVIVNMARSPDGKTNQYRLPSTKLVNGISDEEEAYRKKLSYSELKFGEHTVLRIQTGITDGLFTNVASYTWFWGRLGDSGTYFGNIIIAAIMLYDTCVAGKDADGEHNMLFNMMQKPTAKLVNKVVVYEIKPEFPSQNMEFKYDGDVFNINMRFVANDGQCYGYVFELAIPNDTLEQVNNKLYKSLQALKEITLFARLVFFMQMVTQ